MISFCSKYMGLAYFLLSSIVSAQEKKTKEEIVLSTFQYPPLMYASTDEKGRQGIGLDIIKKAFLSSDRFTLKVKIFPVKRSMMEIERGRADLFLGSRLDLPDLKNNIIPIKLFSLKSVLFCLPKLCEIANKKDSARDLGTIASIPGSPINDYMLGLGNKVVSLQSLEKSFKFFLMKRAQYVAAIDFAGLSMIPKLEHVDAKKIEQAKFNLLEIPYDVIVRKDHPNAKDIIRLIRKEIGELDLKVSAKVLVKEYIKVK